MITPMDGFTVPAGEETVLEPAMLPANDDPGLDAEHDGEGEEIAPSNGGCVTARPVRRP